MAMMTGLPIEDGSRMMLEPVAQRFRGWEGDVERALSTSSRARPAAIAVGLGVGAGLVAKYALGKSALFAFGVVPIVAIPALVILAIRSARQA